MWVAVGSGNSIATSTNGSFWTPSSNGNTIFTNSALSVAWNGSNMWVAVGNGTNTIATSTNGSFWTVSSNGNSLITNGIGVATKF